MLEILQSRHLAVLLFIADAERGPREIDEFLSPLERNASYRIRRTLLDLELVQSSAPGKGAFWTVTDKGRNALRELATTIIKTLT